VETRKKKKMPKGHLRAMTDKGRRRGIRDKGGGGKGGRGEKPRRATGGKGRGHLRDVGKRGLVRKCGKEGRKLGDGREKERGILLKGAVVITMLKRKKKRRGEDQWGK